jgi:hypothetical protein
LLHSCKKGGFGEAHCETEERVDYSINYLMSKESLQGFRVFKSFDEVDDELIVETHS